MAEQTTLDLRLGEKQTHVLNRRTKFAVRQQARSRPAAWQHDCARLVHGRLRRRAERIESFELSAALADVTEVPFVIYSDQPADPSSVFADDSGLPYVSFSNEPFDLGTFSFHPFGGFVSPDFSEEDDYFMSCCADDSAERTDDPVFDINEDFRYLGTHFLIV